MRREQPKTAAELRKFGFGMATPLTILGAATWWFNRPSWPYLTGAAAVFLVLGLLAPGVLRVPEKLWMRFAVILGTVMTFLVLVVTFFVVFTPMGIAMRLFKKMPLELAPDPALPTYWQKVEAPSPYSRPDKPY